MTTQLDARRDLPSHEDLPPRCKAWIKKNRRKFGTINGYPGEFHRQCILESAGPGDRVAWVTTHGSVLLGSVRIRNKDSVVVAIDGSQHGQPAVVDDTNIIWCNSLTRKP